MTAVGIRASQRFVSVMNWGSLDTKSFSVPLITPQYLVGTPAFRVEQLGPKYAMSFPFALSNWIDLKLARGLEWRSKVDYLSAIHC